MNDAERLYRSYVADVIEPDRRAVKQIFKVWRDPAYWASVRRSPATAIPSPIQGTKVRVKRLESLLDKLNRLRSRFPDGLTDETIPLVRDLLGARVVTYFPLHLKLLDDEIRTNRLLEMHPTEQPRSYIPADTMQRIGMDPTKFETLGPKISGYSSIHYTVRIPTGDGSGAWFELQTRTMLSHVWAEIEHQLGYKTQQRTAFSVSRQFRVVSNHMSAIDDHFDFIADHLSYLQSQSSPAAADLINAENLPSVLARIDIPCAQNEIAGVLDILEAYEVRTVNDFSSRTGAAVMEALRRTFAASDQPGSLGAFHIASTIVHLPPGSSPAAAERELRGNLRRRAATYEVRGTLTDEDGDTSRPPHPT